MNISTTSTAMRREIGEDSRAVQSGNYADRSNHRTKAEKEKDSHSVDALLIRSPFPVVVDFGSQNQQCKPFFSPKEKAARNPPLGRDSEGKAIRGIATEKS